MDRCVRRQNGVNIILIITIGAIGCRTETEQSNKPSTERDDAGWEESVDSGPYTLNGVVIDTVIRVPGGMRVVALSNTDLSDLGIEATTEESGAFTLEGIIDRPGPDF